MGEYDDNIQRFAHDNAVFHDIIQHYDDTARPDHDDIDYEPADLDNLDGAEYDHNGTVVLLIDPEFLSAISHIVIAAYEHDGFDNLPDDYEFGRCEFYPTRDRFYRCDNTRNLNDDDDDLPAD